MESALRRRRAPVPLHSLAVAWERRQVWEAVPRRLSAWTAAARKAHVWPRDGLVGAFPPRARFRERSARVGHGGPFAEAWRAGAGLRALNTRAAAGRRRGA